MFDSLTERFSQIGRTLSGRSKLSEQNIEDAVREVRKALLEADVALPVVKIFIERVKTKAIGQQVIQTLNPDQAFIKIVQQELTELMGEAAVPLNLQTTPPAIILLAGLQGAGKTTTAAKLANYLQTQQKKSVMLTSCDVYRPAAIAQLAKLAENIDAAYFPSNANQQPMDIATQAMQQAKKQFMDVLIIDTAGRLHIDAAMMDEIRQLHAVTKPAETLFVIDSMAGQDAIDSATAFNDALPLTGVILTKTDGDARGGVALSVRHITGKPIKFIGTGEKTAALEVFHPERMASRILGMGDVLSLVEAAEAKLDQKQSERLARKMQSGKGFDLADLRDQLLAMQKMGGISSLLDKLPGMANLPSMAKQQLENDQTKYLLAVINSMTPKERRRPELINGSRKQRIARGSGTRIQEVNRVLKQHKQMSKMMQKIGKNGMKNMLRGLSGQLPKGPWQT